MLFLVSRCGIKEGKRQWNGAGRREGGEGSGGDSEDDMWKTAVRLGFRFPIRGAGWEDDLQRLTAFITAIVSPIIYHISASISSLSLSLSNLSTCPTALSNYPSWLIRSTKELLFYDKVSSWGDIFFIFLSDLWGFRILRQSGMGNRILRRSLI